MTMRSLTVTRRATRHVPTRAFHGPLRIAVIALALLLGSPHAARAQSIEESYARLCADSTAARGETCVALRQSLRAKLAAQDSARAGAPRRPSVSEAAAAPAGAQPTRDDSEIERRWGILARLAGNTYFVLERAPHSKQVLDKQTRYEWQEHGRVLVISHAVNGGPFKPEGRFVWEDSTRRIGLVYADASRPTYYGAHILADRSLEYTYEHDRATRVLQRLEPDGSLLETLEENRAGAWHRKSEPTGTWPKRYHPDTPARRAFVAQAAAEAEAQRQEKKSGGGLTRVLAGAAIGAAVAAGHGGSTEQVVGGAMKGVAIVSPGSGAAQALGAQGDALVGGMTAGAGPTAGGASAASGPAKPNLAIAACPGFTTENYRTRAVQRDGDTQLWTMCGQAFDLYASYLRARQQGYAPADLERTYGAHAQAAQVAQGYARSHAAQ